MAAPDEITRAHFDDLLAQYPAVVAAVSAAQAAKPGRKTLLELDGHRYRVAPDCFGPRRRDMTLDDVKALVEWKLRHGKFRPTLMALVASNPPALVQSTIRAALHAYRADDTDTLPAALAALCRLRGVGPATASLLLAVHDPARVVFFSDEAFCWLCRRAGDKAPIRYTAAEYQALARRAAQLTARLGVSPADVERVAYVLVRRRPEPASPPPARAQPEARKAARKRRASWAKPETSPSRDAVGLRRSKRLKK